MLKNFYYQIKGKKDINDYSGLSTNWSFPPIFTGRVSAKDKKEAKEIIDAEYGKKFPLRVLNKDLDSNEFLLNIEEIKEGSHIEKLFELKVCENCESTFYVIDKYNDTNEKFKGHAFCSQKCLDDSRSVDRFRQNEGQNLVGSGSPLIYKITNKHNGQVYIGKTTQIFTLRWYQHFFQHGNCKFHEAIKSSKVTDWLFEIQEIIDVPTEIKTVVDMEKLIIERERFWMNEYNSIENGYNSKN